jgi:ribonuclease-3
MRLQRSREAALRKFLAEPPFCKRNVSDKELEMFNTALTHDSYANEEASRDNIVGSYERLEFLGDAVMDMIVCEHIYSSTDLNEGAMTEFKNEMVSNRNISSRISEKGIDIDSCILVGEGHKEKRTGDSIVEDRMRSDAFEAVIGAVYLLYGTDEARRIINDVFLK